MRVTDNTQTSGLSDDEFDRCRTFNFGDIVRNSLPKGVGWSDHWSFWQFGYQGVMVADIAPFRYPHYHGATDTPDKISYDRLARVTLGLEAVIKDLCRNEVQHKLPPKNA